MAHTLNSAPTTMLVYGDESADERHERVFAIAGLNGTEEEWQDTERVWLRVTSGEVFHAAECEREGKKDLYKALTQVLANGSIAGIAIALDLRAFSSEMPDTLRDFGYYQCFGKVINAHATQAKRWNDRDISQVHEPLLDLKFTFDNRAQSKGNATQLFKTFTNQPEWRDTGIFNVPVSFASRSNPRIQMADLVAREAMKDLDREVGPVKFNERISKRVLEDSNRFKFSKLGNEYCLRLKERIDREQPGVGYAEWLQATGRVQNGRPHDNWTNRALYFAWQDDQNTLGSRT